MKGNFQRKGSLVKSAERFLWTKVIFITLFKSGERSIYILAFLPLLFKASLANCIKTSEGI